MSSKQQKKKKKKKKKREREREREITVVKYPYSQVEKPNSVCMVFQLEALKQTRTQGFLQYARNEKPEDR